MTSFAQFWPYYVREHRRAATRWWHVVGTTLALAVAITGLALGPWWLVLLALGVGYGPAWMSHFLIERNRPATFRYPLWSLAADLKLWWLAVTGRMAGETARILAATETERSPGGGEGGRQAGGG